MEVELHFVESCANCEYGITTGSSFVPCRKHNIVSLRRLKCIDFKWQKKLDFTKTIYQTEGARRVEVRSAWREHKKFIKSFEEE